MKLQTKLRINLALLFCTSFVILSAIAADKKTVDIGNLEVNGDVRKPLLGYVESDQALRDHVRETSKSKLVEFERKISKFKTVSEWKGEPTNDFSTHR